jgi:hypothetical protein
MQRNEEMSIQWEPFLPFAAPFSTKKRACGPKEGRYVQKASAQVFRISDRGFRIFLVFFFNPHSAIGIPQFGGGPIGRPAHPIKTQRNQKELFSEGGPARPFGQWEGFYILQI